MDKRKIEVLSLLLLPDNRPFNFHNIETNTAAQEWLKHVGRELTSDSLFEEIYQIEQDYAREMRKRRSMRRSRRLHGEPSYLDTIEKELTYYDDNAREVTVTAMNWLKQFQEEQQSCINSSEENASG